MSEIFFDQNSGQYFMQPQAANFRLGMYGGMGNFGNYKSPYWGMSRQPMMPLQNFGKSMVAEMTANQYKGGGAPSLASLFPGLSSPQSYSDEQSYQQPSQSSGAGRFTGLLGGK